MNRTELQQFTEDRILDAQALLAAGRWSAAYYLTGYAVECGLKSCVLAHVLSTGIIFQERKFSEQCWTHDLDELVRLAGLEATLGVDASANPSLANNWLLVKKWSETSRYGQKTELDARELFATVNDTPNGMLPWIRKHW